MKKFILTESQYKILLKEMSDDISMPDMYKNVISNPTPKSDTAVTPEKDLGTFDGWKRVRKRGTNKMNLKNVENGEYVSQTWYDFVGSMINGIAIVIDNNKGVNAIDANGELLFRSWHEDINEKKDGEEYTPSCFSVDVMNESTALLYYTTYIGDYIELGVVDNANELKKYYLETADTKDIEETGWN